MITSMLRRAQLLGCADPAPVDPTSVAATPDSPAIGVAVSWTASSTAQYNVYRNTTNSTTGATLVGSSSGSGGMSYVDNSANSGSNRPLASTTYFYWVQGVTCGGTSALIPASQNSTGGVSTAAITYTTYLSNNANLTVSDYVNIAEQSTTRLRFSRPAGSVTTWQNNFPGSRVSFVTDATYLRVIMYYNANPGSILSLGMVGAVLVNNVEHSTFTYTGSVPGSGTHDITLPGGSNTVSILWQTGAYVDLTSVALDSGASIGTATRPSTSVVFAGDSITQGFSATKPTVAWSNQVATAQGRKSFNLGYGNASTQWLDAVTMLAAVPTADLGTLMIGINDAGSQLPLAVYGSNVRGWLLKAKSLMSDPRLFMCSPIYCNVTHSPITTAQYRTEAKNTVEAMMTYGNGDSKLFYLDGLALMPSNNSGLTDGVHPNDTGSNEIATNINAAMNATPPAAPSGLAATVISSSQVDLSWTDNASTETGFIVQRRFPATTGSWQQVGVTLAGTTTFSDTGLASSSQYEYRVCAYNGGGSSAFTSSVTPTTSAGTANRIRVLVIGGGGGGGDAGGGGGGGARHDTAFVATPGTTYNIVIGAGGAAGGVGARGGSGVASSFDTISAAGGGGGGAFSATLQNGIDGGCGGGAGTDSGGGFPSGTAGAGNTPNTSPSQGNNGGTAQGGTRFGFGGGGGAGSVGRNGSNAIVSGSQGGYGGEGGDGASNNIRGLYEQFAGGGGGGGWQVGGVGGRGGGGDGQCYLNVARNPTAGTVNSGGGGGGGFASAGGGSAGGSGIVVLRMPTSEYTGVTTGSPAVTTSGNDTVLTFTASGSYKA